MNWREEDGGKGRERGENEEKRRKKEEKGGKRREKEGWKEITKREIAKSFLSSLLFYLYLSLFF